MFLAQTSAEALLAAIFSGTDFVASLRHFACLPEAVMLAAVAFRDYFATAVLSLAGAFTSHWSFSEIFVSARP
jgi:hypothetical protein